ncbi:GNAT family N-acetyltransferase [Dokdonella sp.]|uniref:GNAT family N-acetyltransferase n=1 Tax=Dokdonella sp. TaxID=2291710 RepID=UPI003C5F9697
MELRDACEADFDRIVELNEGEVQQTSPMDRQRLIELDRLSSFHKVAIVDGQIAAFLLAMREGADYDSENYNWFSAHYSRFVYVDRIVVSAEYSGKGIGARLYQRLFEQARSDEAGRIACEYNIEPPNHASRAFHDRFGFVQVGTQWVAGDTKRVSLQVAQL